MNNEANNEATTEAPSAEKTVSEEIKIKEQTKALQLGEADIAHKKLSFINRIKRAIYFGVARSLAKRGRKGVYAIADTIAGIVWKLYKKRRNLAITNIHERLGLSVEDATKMARSAFNHNMRSFLDCLLVPDYDYTKDPDFKVEGQEFLDRIHAMPPRPVLVITGHLGAWEFIAALRNMIKTDGCLGVAVVRRYGDDAFNELMCYLRGSHGVTVIGHRNAARPILRNLRNNGFVSFLVDHHVVNAAEAKIRPFLGKETGVNMGPAVLAVRANAILLPLAVFRTEKSYILHVEEYLDPLDMQGTKEEKIDQAVTFYTEAMEKMIKMHPEQWFWLHNRWK